jgi:hypothetical protein
MKTSQPRTPSGRHIMHAFVQSRPGTVAEKSGDSNIPSKDQFNGRAIDATYDSVSNPNSCEWNFLFCALPFGVASKNRFILYL